MKYALLARTCLVLSACSDPEPDDFVSLNLESFYFLPQEGSRFQVDSLIFDPAVGGTAKLRSTTTWEFTCVDSSASAKTYTVSVVDSTGTAAAPQFWQFENTSSGLVHLYDGISYLAIGELAETRRDWNPLVFTDPDLIVSIAGEPVEIHKGWSAVLDSVGRYTLPNGSEIDAVWISLADSENLLELRRVQEVYGRGEGLLERHLEILDTQQTASSADWLEKAERGFALSMRRIQ